MSSSFEKLNLVRDSLHKKSIDAYIIPSADPHIGENMSDHWQVIAWLTGFIGSNATVIITDSFAGVWTDSRYFIQAEEQISDSGFSLFRPGIYQSNDFADYLAEGLTPKSTVGFDGRIVSVSQLRELKKKLAGKKIIINSECDLISDLWYDRPLVTGSTAFDLPVKFCGRDRERKIAEVRGIMKDKNLDYHLLTAPDDIMWLLNMRGNDQKYSPLITSFALIGMQQILLFVDDNKIPIKLAHEFDKLGIVMLPYDEAGEIISAISGRKSILISPDTTSVALFNSIPKRLRKIEDISIPARLKSVKNKTEIENISGVMIKDGVALTNFLFWVEKSRGENQLTEKLLAEKLFDLRSKQDGFLGNSFASIVAYNEHSALPHYNPLNGPVAQIGEGGILLIDSGGQYLGGTTDITRTISIGEPSERQKKDFTLILKGHIDLATAKFPAGTRGYQLDILARKALWDHGLNYGHGTGHGVGFCLNVHEGPQNISPSANKTIIEPGMLISNEPALYREGEYGIRTENLILCYEYEETDFGRFLKFETLSLCYIDKSLIETAMLSPPEIKWLNFYHSEVYEKLSPYLNAEEKLWLKEKTEQI